MEVEMKIRGLMMDPVTNMPIVVLKDVGSDTVLPIWVGVYEANAIALEIEKVTTPRPMTHDLIKNLQTVWSGYQERDAVVTQDANGFGKTLKGLQFEAGYIEALELVFGIGHGFGYCCSRSLATLGISAGGSRFAHAS